MPIGTYSGEFRVHGEADMKFTPQGKAVVKLRCVAGDRRLNRQTNEWENGDSLWVTVEAWDELAEEIANSVHDKDVVLVTGKMVTEEYTDNQNQRRSVTKLKAFDVALSLAAKARAAKRQGQSQQTGGQGQWGQQAPAQNQWAQPAQNAPQNTPQQGQQAWGNTWGQSQGQQAPQQAQGQSQQAPAQAPAQDNPWNQQNYNAQSWGNGPTPQGQQEQEPPF